MRLAGAGVKLTYDDFVLFPDERGLYERMGVSEYWFVDPKRDVIRVYRRVDDRFANPTELSRKAGEILPTPLLPGLDLPLERIFRE